ncbi:MAG TPA: hypothetical protein VGQ06_13365 [Gemmatimonadales bacterium]|nr:hypothetical protein [Gemmatimonadales bacterium]
MRRSTLAICALLTVATFGCDKLQQAWDQVRGKRTTQTPPPPRPTPQSATDTGAARVAAAPQEQQRPDRPPRPPTLPGAPVLRDVPYVSNDTGTIAPGMAEREIYALWGAPAAVRRVGEFTYLFFNNGCEYTCGTMDVVTLQNGQVVDAIVRWDGHRYAGESSSPPGKMPVPNVGGDTLRVPPP